MHRYYQHDTRVLKSFVLNLPALGTALWNFWMFASIRFLCHKRNVSPTNADSNVIHSHCLHFCSRVSRWLFSVSTSCNITYAAHQRGGSVSALGRECSCVCISAQKGPFQKVVVYVCWYPLRLTVVADGRKSWISLWRWVGVVIRWNWECFISVLNSSVAKSVETADRLKNDGLPCKVNFSGMKWRNYNENNCSGICKLA